MKTPKFLKSEGFLEWKYKTLQTILAHQNIIDVGLSISRSITSFAQSKSPLSFVEGGISGFNSIAQLFGGSSDEFFSQESGWEVLAYISTQRALYDIILSGLEPFPFRKLSFAKELDKNVVYSIPNFSVGKTRRAIYYRPKDGQKEDLLQFIMDEKVKGSNSKIFSITERNVSEGEYNVVKFDLSSEENIGLPSETSDTFSNYIKGYIAAGISRSIILNGLPGVGKSSLAHNILKDLDLKTLKFKYNKSTNASIINIIPFLVQSLGIESILLDDFDHTGESYSLLELLEWLHRHTKLVIATTNSLKSFHPAVLRPGRFDLVRTIDQLDDGVVRSVLGDLYETYADKVEKWPVAYVNELAVRIRVNPEANPEEYIKELQSRVSAQYAILKSS